MDFGVLVLPKADRCGQEARLAEACGFTHVWVGDTQMMAGDMYVCLGLIAQQTRRVKLGTGVAVAGTRTAPVTAHSIATINQLAPGRVILGIGTGNSARRAMGLPPCSLHELREHVRVVRGLLQGEEVVYQEGAARRAIRFFHQDFGFINTRDPVPIYVAANAPRAMELAGEIGDGFITSRTNSLEGWQGAWTRVRRGAEQAGKEPSSLYTTLLTTACLLHPGESYDSPRVKAQAGPWAMVALHALYDRVQDPAATPEPIRSLFAEYQAFIDNQRQRAGERYYLELHDGHGIYVRPEEARFVTPEVIRTTTMTATPEELVERLHTLESAGVKQVAFIPAPEGFAEFVREFGEKVIARF
jgi:alkanesulfonate monooxygenase SsuD/methylene tetrahydromethanopterin reductase-like flavin-dependent oxidoreductase (luciferase family)